jgi:hypothetical protein
LEKRAEQVLPGSNEVREIGRGWGQGGEMAQTNKKRNYWLLNILTYIYVINFSR